MLAPWKKSSDQPRQHIKKQRHYFANKGPSSQSYGFSSSHLWMWELDDKESWAQKNGWIWTVVLEKILVSSMDCKVNKYVKPKRNQSWIFIGRSDAEDDAALVWPPDAKKLTHWKQPWCWPDWRQEEKGRTEHEMVESHHQLDGLEFEQVPGAGDWQGRPTCCSPWVCKASDTTVWMYCLIDTLCTWSLRRAIVSKSKTGSWLWLGSWTPYCKIQN